MDGHGKRWLVVPLAALGSLLAGCASQGPLRPPSLNLPAPVRHLAAERTGDSVDLSWTNPAKTSDGAALTAKHGAGALTAEICRSENTLTDSCTPIFTMPVRSGEPATWHDALPPAQAAGAVRALYYRVRVVNMHGKGAKWAEVTTAAGAAPEALGGLQAFPVANGILLRWKPGEGGSPMFRVSRGSDTAHSTLLRVSDLQAGGGRSISFEGSGGTVDTGGHVGQEQRYIGFRQNTVQLGETSVVIKSSAVSLVVPATAKLPLPAPPTALEAVVNTLGKPEVDLVWQPPDDVSVTGYRVYRQDGESQPVLLTAEAIRGFTFADTAVQGGHRYSYRVSAVNPSGESPAVSATAVLP